MPPTHQITQALFLGIDDEQSKEELWNLFDSLVLKLLLRTQVRGWLKGDEAEAFWLELYEKHPKILLVTVVTTDKAQAGI